MAEGAEQIGEFYISYVVTRGASNSKKQTS